MSAIGRIALFHDELVGADKVDRNPSLIIS